jgi:hypothetical protein
MEGSIIAPLNASFPPCKYVVSRIHLAEVSGYHKIILPVSLPINFPLNTKDSVFLFGSTYAIQSKEKIKIKIKKVYFMQLKFLANVKVFAMAGYFVFRYAGTEADFCFVAEDNYKCSTALRCDEN